MLENKSAKKVREVCDKLAKDSLLIKPKEKAFVVLSYPISQTENVLDAHLFAYGLVEAMRTIGAEANLLTIQGRKNPLLRADGVYNSLCMLWGFLHTPIDESIYGKFEAFRKELERQLRAKGEKVDWLSPPDVFFFIRGGAFYGRDVVATSLGFPIPRAKKERWESTLNMLNKYSWTLQSKMDKRKPVSRTALTETLPLETYIRTLSVDYRKIAKTNAKIRKILEESSIVKIIGKPVRVGTHVFKTSLEINVESRLVKTDDGVFSAKNNFLNLPAGETFVTPNDANGVYVADGTITLDKSYLLKTPFVAKFKRGKFNPDQIICIDKEINRKFSQVIKSHKEYLRKIKRKKTLSRETVRAYERNFYQIGELGIGTNPQARVSQWLIESEKALRTVHIALGSGYEPEARTVHHEDIVAGLKTPLTVEAFVDGKPVKIIDEGKLAIK